MLTSLLPGLRQIRAPLSSGFVWLVALWLLAEPLIDRDSEVGDTLSSMAEVLGSASGIGIGAAWTFVAYLLGSLSMGTLVPLLRRLLDKQWLRGDRSSVATLQGLSVRTRVKLQAMLEFTDANIDVLIREHLAESRSRRQGALAWLVARARARWGRPAGEPEQLAMAPSSKIATSLTSATPGVSRPSPLPETESDDELARLREDRISASLMSELEEVAVSRLLGKEAELYGEWDRERAEVEFRLALAPAVVLLAIAIVVRVPDFWWWAPIVAALIAWGLIRDAARSEDLAQTIVIVALANDRVQSPAIERLTVAAQVGSRYGQEAEIIRSVTRTASGDFTNAVAGLEHLFASEAANAQRSVELVDVAASSFRAGDDLFDPVAQRHGEVAVRELADVAQAWLDVIDGKGAPTFDAQSRLRVAQVHHARFLQAIREQLERVTTTVTEATGPTPPGDPVPPSPRAEK